MTDDTEHTLKAFVSRGQRIQQSFDQALQIARGEIKPGRSFRFKIKKTPGRAAVTNLGTGQTTILPDPVKFPIDPEGEP